MKQTPTPSQEVSDDYKLLLTPPFATMTRITENLFLTGVGGMTRSNFARNHIDFVVNITTDAPFWQDTESMRIALEDDSEVNMLHHLDVAVDKINEVICKRNAHVLVHCVAGVSRSATIVIGYLMKYRRLDLKSAFNYCYHLRPVIRPNNGFMAQLIDYEQQLFGRPSSVQMVEADVDGTTVRVPNFFLEEHPRLVLLEVLRTRDLHRMQTPTAALNQMQAAPPTAQQHAARQVQQQLQVHQQYPQFSLVPQPQTAPPDQEHRSGSATRSSSRSARRSSMSQPANKSVRQSVRSPSSKSSPSTQSKDGT